MIYLEHGELCIKTSASISSVFWSIPNHLTSRIEFLIGNMQIHLEATYFWKTHTQMGTCLTWDTHPSALSNSEIMWNQSSTLRFNEVSPGFEVLWKATGSSESRASRHLRRKSFNSGFNGCVLPAVLWVKVPKRRMSCSRYGTNPPTMANSTCFSPQGYPTN